MRELTDIHFPEAEQIRVVQSLLVVYFLGLHQNRYSPWVIILS